MEINDNGHCRIVLTGGPGAGKTTAAGLFRREIGDRVVIVPEAATLLFRGGFPRAEEPHARVAAQKAIYHVQRNLEDVQANLYPDRVLLCDRGTLDSAIYWPEGNGDGGFYSALETSKQAEMARYDAVIFFETAAIGEVNIIEGGNPTRHENLEQAIALDRKLQSVWSEHEHYSFIPHQASFMHKLNNALECIKKVVDFHTSRNDS